MRRVVLLLTAALLLSACAARARAQAPPSSPSLLPGPEAAAPAAAPTAAPALPQSEALRVAPDLAVQIIRNTKVYTGRGPWYLLVDELRAGSAAEYLGSREGWLLVRTPGGGSGWLASADAVLTDAGGGAVTYRVQPSLWEMRTAVGPAVRVSRAPPGVIHVQISGLTGERQVVTLADGNLAVLAAVPGNPQAGLSVGDGGVTAVSLSGQGVLVDLERAPLYRVVSDRDDGLELEFRPGLDRLEAMDNGWRLALRGDVQPVLRRGDNGLILDLPNTTSAPDLGRLPAGVSLEVVGPEPNGPAAAPQLSAPTLAVPSRMVSGGLRLKLPAPTGPYALYRPEPGTLELRLLAPGLAGKTIVVDAGHGGEETGAAGDYSAEKDINLAVALRLQPLLEQAGARVTMTRTTDARVLPPARAAALSTASERTRLDLEQRVDMANAAGADLYLSIHANGGGSLEEGTETFWAQPNLNVEQSRRLAGLVQDEVLAALGLVDRGVKQRPFHVVRFTYAPAALVELGFMTNPAEEALLASAGGHAAAARALLRAVERFFAG